MKEGVYVGEDGKMVLIQAVGKEEHINVYLTIDEAQNLLDNLTAIVKKKILEE